MAHVTTMLTLPAHWASYLINNDPSGLSDDDKNVVDWFVTSQIEQYTRFEAIDVGEEFFAWSHDAQHIIPLGATCAEFTFIVEERPCL